MPHIWVVEMAQFTMAAYYILGGGYSMQLGSHVRMDLLYGRWSERTKAIADVITACGLIFYLVFLLYGGISSAQYALEYDQRNYSAWAPPMAPINPKPNGTSISTLAQKSTRPPPRSEGT